MTSLPFFQVDAFADRPFAGNPAAVIPLEHWLADDVLQAVAAENNLSETAFYLPAADGEGADFALRWFTPTTEVRLCGHATLAAGHVVLSQSPDRDVVRFATRHSGVLTVTRAGEGRHVLGLPACRPEARPLPRIVAALGLADGDVESFWHDRGYALILLPDEAAVRAVRPDFGALAALGSDLVIVTAPGTDTDIVSRVFAPACGIDEDPVTGSAHGVLAPWWAERLGRPAFTAFQASARGGRLDCRLDGGQVLLGGACVTVIEGRFRL